MIDLKGCGLVTSPPPKKKERKKKKERQSEREKREKRKKKVWKRVSRPGALKNPVGKSYRPAGRI